MALRTVNALFLVAALVGLASCGGGAATVNLPPGPVQFHCSKDSSCPEVMVAGDPFDEVNMVPDAFRGYVDPFIDNLRDDPRLDAVMERVGL